MSEYFDPSPRSSKRRKTTTHEAAQFGLNDTDDSDKPQVRAAISSKQFSRQKDGFEDSAYGSKEDSLVEDESGVGDQNNTVEMADVLQADKQSQTYRSTPKVVVPPRGGRQVTPVSDDTEQDDENTEDTIEVQPRSSGRERRKPRRYSVSPKQPRRRQSRQLVEKTKVNEAERNSVQKLPATKAATPKGILTPSRKEKRLGPKKSVIFDQAEKDIEEQFGFKDINEAVTKPKSPSKAKASKPASNAIELTSSPSIEAKSRQKSIPSTTAIPLSEPEFEPEYEDVFAEFTNEPLVDNFTLEEDSLEDDGSELSGLSVEDHPSLLAVKSIVLNRLISRDTTEVPTHLRSQYDTLYTLLQATVISGESNSILLLGARGAGKSHLLNAAISDLNANHTDDFHTVRLNGFFQTDDKVALREIWRQLGREMQVDEMESGDGGGSYADTMSSLLSLLSHPDEFIEPSAAAGGNRMEIDTGAVRTSKSIIFVLDEFDLFTTHPRQTLLYNLFDIAQSKKAPIAVVGCSTRMDVVDCLEKRVKSRFSHRWLHIPSAKTLDGFTEIMTMALCVEENGVATIKLSKSEMQTRKAWNEYIKSVFMYSSQVQDLMKRVFYTTKAIPELFSALYIPIATLQIPASTQVGHQLVAFSKDICTTAQPVLLMTLPSLPTLHLALLIAAARLDTIHNLTNLNFNLVYAHYVELISRSKLQVTASGAVAVGASLRQWKVETAIAAWEDLGLHECIVPVSGAAVVGAGGRDSGSVGGDVVGGEGANVRMWRVEVTLDDLVWAVKEKWTESGGVRDVLGKWCREI